MIMKTNINIIFIIINIMRTMEMYQQNNVLENKLEQNCYMFIGNIQYILGFKWR